MVQRAPLSTIGLLGDTSLRVVIVAVLLFIARVVQIHQSNVWTNKSLAPGLSSGADFLYRRRQVDRLEQLLVEGKHLFVTGAAGVGKTDAVKLSLLNYQNTPGRTRVAACYIDLLPLASSLRTDAPPEILHSIIKELLKTQVEEYELSILKMLRDISLTKWMTAFLSRHALALPFSSFQSAMHYSTLPPLSATRGYSVYADILNHIVSSTEQLNGLLVPETQFQPVLVLDGVHLLTLPFLSALNNEIAAVLTAHLPLKRRAKLTVWMISNENGQGNAKLLEFKHSSLLQHEVVGDLTAQEARTFLLHLNKRYHSGRGANNNKNSSSWDEVEDASALQLQITSSRLYKRVTDEKEFDLIYNRYGGHIADLARFASTQYDTPDEDVQVADRSNIHFLAQNLESTLAELEISNSAQSLLTLYRTLLEIGKSPRSAVLLSELVDVVGIAEADVQHFAKLGLIELREANPEVLDYPMLKTATESYVCGVSPLARYSMARAVKKIKSTPTSSSPTKKAGVRSEL